MSEVTITPAPAGDLLAQLQAYNDAAPDKSAVSTTTPPPSDQLDALTAMLASSGGKAVAIPPVLYLGQPWAGPERNPVTSYAEALRSRLCRCKGGNGTYIWVAQVAWGTATEHTNADGKTYKTYSHNGVQVKSAIPDRATVVPGYDRSNPS